MNCEINHKNRTEILEELPKHQLGPGRHKCAGCAYEKGLEDGRNRKMILNITQILNQLPDSQAKPQRHKDAHIAYIKGYYDGINKTNQ